MSDATNRKEPLFLPEPSEEPEDNEQQETTELTRTDVQSLFNKLRNDVRRDMSSIMKHQKQDTKVRKEIDGLRKVLRDKMGVKHAAIASDADILKQARKTIEDLHQRHHNALCDIRDLEAERDVLQTRYKKAERIVLDTENLLEEAETLESILKKLGHGDICARVLRARRRRKASS